jgi:hypothetical protein
MALSIRDQMTLRLAFTSFTYPAVRASRALDELGYTESRFWMRVEFLIGMDEVERAWPAEVRRLRRLREARRTARQSTSPRTTFA